MRQRIQRGSEFERLLNYSRVVVDDDGWVFVSGCSGFDYDTMEISDDITTQAEQTFETFAGPLSKRDARLAMSFESGSSLPACPIIRRQ